MFDYDSKEGIYMIAEILSIGTELLMGQVTNTDASYLARQMSHLGIIRPPWVTIPPACRRR